MNKKQLLALLASYGRSILSAGITLYLAGFTDPKQLFWALIGAIVPVALRYMNPNDVAFGRVPTPAEVDNQVTDAVTKKIKK